MLAPSDRLHLALERILLGWQYVSQDIQQDRSDLFQLVIALITAALAAIGSVLVDKVPAWLGLGFAALMLAGAVYVVHRRRVLRRRLRRSSEVALESIKRLMAGEEE